MGLISAIIDLYENFRKTDTKVESSKLEKRKYDFESGLTGNKKIDCSKYKPTKCQEKISKEEKER